MNRVENDSEYIKIVKSILYNPEFNKIKNIEHHGISRYEHSIRVSYYSYKIAKTLKLNYENIARGGLLHDYFISPCDRNYKQRFISTFIHPQKAIINSKKVFMT